MDTTCAPYGGTQPSSEAPSGLMVCTSCHTKFNYSVHPLRALGPPATAEELAELERLNARLDAYDGGFVINWWRRRKTRRELVDFTHAAAARRRADFG